MANYSIFSDENTPNDFKAIVGGAVNDSFDLSYIAPQFDNTHQQRMEDWLSSDLYDDLVAAMEGTPTAEQLALLPYYRKPLAWLSLHDYLPFAEAQITGAGVSRVENENYKTAYKDQIRKIQQQTIQNGYESLERLILFLDAHRDDYPDWENAPGFNKHHGTLLNSALAFRSVYDKSISRQVFEESLVGCLADAEAFSLVTLMGQDQYDALLAARRDDTWTSETKEKKAILLAQKVSAHFSLSEALLRNYVRIEGNRVVQAEYTPEQAVPSDRTALPLAVGARRQLHDERANAYLSALKKYLDLNIEDDAFSNYKAYQAELAEAAAAAAEEAASTNTLPGDLPLAVSAGWNGTTGRKGFVRF